MRHLHDKESAGHKGTVSLIEPVVKLSIKMGRVNYAKEIEGFYHVFLEKGVVEIRGKNN